MEDRKKLSSEAYTNLINALRVRFERNPARHPGLEWSTILSKLEDDPSTLWSLNEMERTEGEPDVVDYDVDSGVFLFMDCSAESPKGRRSLCYDREALDSRKEYKPAGSVMEVAAAMGVELLTEAQYRFLQQMGKFDLKTSSWVQTPPEIRKHGGAIFCDRRYDHVFTYHNGAESYYAARGFRGMLRV